MFGNISYLVGRLFVLLSISFAVQKLVKLISSHSCTSAFPSLALGVTFTEDAFLSLKGAFYVLKISANNLPPILCRWICPPKMYVNVCYFTRYQHGGKRDLCNFPQWKAWSVKITFVLLVFHYNWDLDSPYLISPFWSPDSSCRGLASFQWDGFVGRKSSGKLSWGDTGAFWTCKSVLLLRSALFPSLGRCEHLSWAGTVCAPGRFAASKACKPGWGFWPLLYF